MSKFRSQNEAGRNTEEIKIKFLMNHFQVWKNFFSNKYKKIFCLRKQ